uniref:Fibronectin type-III domain-containing protein n=2 Tax=Esox lucius TaxID=8010 RepID=A0A6Q2WT23_ESOLU
MVGIWLFLLISLQGYKASFTPSVNCLIMNLDYVICRWSEWGSPEVNSTFFHNNFNTSNEHMEECSAYLQEKGYAVGCRLEYEMADRFRTLLTKLVHQNKTYEQKHDLKDKVKLYPPANLSLVMSEAQELNLYWNNSKINHCFESEVRYRINNDNWQSTSPRREQTHTVPFPSNSQYEFQVRTRIHNGCCESKFWSEWSQIILWDSMKGNNTTEKHDSSMPFWKPLLSFVGTLVLLILACMLVCGERERLRFFLIPIVPNPGKNLKDLLDSDNEEGLPHISKHISFQPNFTELTCSVSEYTRVPLTGSISESESNLSNPTNQSDCLSSCSSSASTLPDTSEN